jgi:suppressor of ftsI
MPRLQRPSLARRAVFTFLCTLVACSGGTIATPPQQRPVPQAGDLSNPPEVASDRGVARLTLSAVIDPSTGGPAIEYDGALIPPTIRVKAGDTIDLTYANKLPPSSHEPFNATNLHFHGLTTSPNPPADDSIDVYAMPGQTLHYRVRIPATQPPGLFWYHSHAHGESNWQVYNGMSGAIVVTGTSYFSRETSGLPERIIVLRNVLAHPSFASTRPHAPPKHGGSPCGKPFDIPGEYTTINGRSVGGKIVMQPGQHQLWRVVNASSNGYYDLSVDGATLHVVAIDGVPLNAYPGAHERQVHDFVVPPAGRVEFIVDGAAPGAAFRTACTDTGETGDPNPAQVLATVSAGTAVLPVVPTPGATPPPFGTYEETIGDQFAQQRQLFFSENYKKTAFYINGRQYSPDSAPMFTARAGTVERWTLQNDTQEVHAFHIHQVHFIVQDVDGVRQPQVWWDTLNLPPAHRNGRPSIVHVLVDFRDPVVRGTFLFHCHILQHEDLGMMAKIAVK